MLFQGGEDVNSVAGVVVFQGGDDVVNGVAGVRMLFQGGEWCSRYRGVVSGWQRCDQHCCRCRCVVSGR